MSEQEKTRGELPRDEGTARPASPKHAPRVLIVDDEEGMRNYLSVVLRKAGFATAEAADGQAGYDMLTRQPFDVVLEDLKMPRLDGIGLLRHIREDFPDVAVVVMTAFSTWESAVEAMRLGAFNYIRKPFDNDEIRSIVRHAAEVVDATRCHMEGEESFVYRQIIGNTPDIRQIQQLVKRVATTDSTVCIHGESGTGKELIARAIHCQSSRRHGPFIAVNCGAFAETLLESELFGHVKGAFTGAVSDKQGLFEAAKGGTFFLDEVADMSKQLQAKLLRTIEEREILPVGSTQTVKTDVRLVTASNRTIEQEVARGNFREDLFYRLNVIPIKLPPLRERKGDIPFLVGHFLGKHGKSAGENRHVTGITKEALDVLFAHDWPGNIRELENTIQRAVALASGTEITPAELTSGSPVPGAASTGAKEACGTAGTSDAVNGTACPLPAGGLHLEDHLEDIEKTCILEALRRCDHVVTRAADLLHIDVRALRYRIKKLHLRPEEPDPQIAGQPVPGDDLRPWTPDRFNPGN